MPSGISSALMVAKPKRKANMVAKVVIRNLWSLGGRIRWVQLAVLRACDWAERQIDTGGLERSNGRLRLRDADEAGRETIYKRVKDVQERKPREEGTVMVV